MHANAGRSAKGTASRRTPLMIKKERLLPGSISTKVNEKLSQFHIEQMTPGIFRAASLLRLLQ
jgi:hypothetical protein